VHSEHFPFFSRNPNEHHRQDSSLPVSKERNRFRSITWENYDPLHQKYLEIGESEENSHFPLRVHFPYFCVNGSNGNLFVSF